MFMTNFMKVEISVVIPCYGAEKFLSNITECLRQQTYQNFEIIFVNDGGSEEQVRVMEKLAANNTKIKIIHQPNGGVSKARNAGIDASSGSWIVFADADDDIKPYYLQSLRDAGKNNNADIVISGFSCYHFRNQVQQDIFIELPNYDKIYSVEDLFTQRKLLYDSPCNKLFNSNFLKNNKFYFPLNFSFYEDEIFMSEIFVHSAPVILFVRDCGYIYNLRDDSSASSKYHAKFAEFGKYGVSLLKKIILNFSWDDEKKKQYIINITNILGYDICCNYFKKGNQLSFKEKKQAIRTEVLDDQEIILCHKQRSNKNDFRLKVYHWFLKTNNAFFITLFFNLIFLFKYRFYGLFVKLLKANKKLN